MIAGACCPACRGALDDALTCRGCGRTYETLGGVPVLVADADPATVDMRTTGGALPTYDCAQIGIASLDAALARGDRILELGAGLDVNTAVVRTDGFVYSTEHLDAVADAHALPFADGSFDYVFSLAVFEHLHTPWRAVEEIARVLRPGGEAFTLCAFLQPLHGYPDHYFNATERGLSRLFEGAFDVRSAGPSLHCGHQESLAPQHRMREMARTLRDDRSAPPKSRARAALLDRALSVAGRQFMVLVDELLARPAAAEAWRHVAPAVEVHAVRR